MGGVHDRRIFLREFPKDLFLFVGLFKMMKNILWKIPWKNPTIVHPPLPGGKTSHWKANQAKNIMGEGTQSSNLSKGFSQGMCLYDVSIYFFQWKIP